MFLRQVTHEFMILLPQPPIVHIIDMCHHAWHLLSLGECSAPRPVGQATGWPVWKSHMLKANLANVRPCLKIKCFF